MALTVLLDLRLKPEAQAGAPAVLRDILAGTRAFEGCLGVDVLIDALSRIDNVVLRVAD